MAAATGDSHHGTISNLTPGAISYTQSSLASLTLDLGPGGNTVNINSTPNHGPAGTVNTDITSDGNDLVTVGQGGLFQGITGTIYKSPMPADTRPRSRRLPRTRPVAT